MGLSRTGSEACLVYTVLGTLGRRAGPPSSAGRLFVVSIRRSCTSDPAWYMMVSKRVSNDSIRFLSRSNRTKMPGGVRRRPAKAPRTRTGRRTDTATHANTSSILNVTASSETAVPRPRSLRSGLSAASALTLLPYRLRLYVPNRVVRLQLQDGSRPRPLPARWSPPLATPWADGAQIGWPVS
jgi:hypothetical protein